ncbi:MAG TPA: polysaccharide biosynthesis/export family protein [Dongiaceae bacterium]|jgi:polysaccharide export outer membrane protein|nr:polysaccharide biosynthesis/export family protein [Dongiaceae bacterium]
MKMRSTVTQLLVVLLLLGLAACTPANKTPLNTVAQFNAEYQRVKSEGYRIHPGDVLDITFFYTPEYNATNVPVRPDGKIQLPLAGDFAIAGMTPDQAGAALKKVYSSQLKNPDLAIMVKTFGANSVVVQGSVRNPGELPLSGDASLLQTIGRAGSFTDTADLSKVTVVRHSTGSTPMVIVLDLRKALTGAAPQLDIPLLPGDVIFVPDLNGKQPSAVDLFGTTPSPSPE